MYIKENFIKKDIMMFYYGDAGLYDETFKSL